jgi:tetratricopeptide (TPR) repeat protein
MARVDSLPGEAKEVLQTGASIERKFSYELIKQITGLSEKKLMSNLSALKDSELLYERGIAYTSYGISLYGKGFFDKAIESILKGAEFCEKINLLQWNGLAQFNLGEIYYDIGDYQKSEEHYSKSIMLFKQNRSSPSTANLASLGLVRTKVMKNEKDVTLKSIQSNEYESSYKIHDGWKARYLSEIVLNIDDQPYTEAENWIKKAVEADKRNGMRSNLAKDYGTYSEIFKKQGEKEQASEKLGKTIDIYKECGADGWVEKYEEEMTEL